MNWKRLSPYAVPATIRLAVVLLVGFVLTYVLLVSDPTRIFRWFPIRTGTAVVTDAPDWAQHFVAYFTLSFLLSWYAAAKARWIGPCLAGGAVLHAMATEFLQRFVPQRTSDWKDLVVNFAGIAMGTLIGRVAMWLLGAEPTNIEPALAMHPQRFPQEGRGAYAPRRITLAAIDLGANASRLGKVARETTSLGMSRGTLTGEDLRPTRVLNYGFLGGLCVVTGTLLGTIHVVHGWQIQQHASSLMELGRKARANGDLKGAKDYVGRYVGLMPRDIVARADYGLLLDQTGASPKQVFMVFEDVLRVDQTREDIRRRQIEISMSIGRYSDALAHVRYLRQSGHADATLDFQAARCLEELAEYTDALAAYEATLERDPKLMEAYERLAWLCQTRLDRPEQAKAKLDKLVERFPNTAVSWRTRGRFRAEFGSLIAAQSDMDRALTLDPHGLETQLASARLAYDQAIAAQANGRDAQARKIVADSRQKLQHAIGEHPEQIELRLRLAQLEIHFGSANDARQQIDEAIKLRPRDERAQLQLVELNLEQGRFEEARQAVNQLPRTPQSDALRRFVEGRRHMSQAEWNEAVKELDEARRISTQASGLTERTELALAECHAALGDAEAQTAALRRALKSNPASIPARLGLAACLQRQQKANEAIAEFRPLAHLPQVRLPLLRLLIARNLQMPELARDWVEVERLFDPPPESSDSAHEKLLRAELMAARGQTDAARQLIADAGLTAAEQAKFWLALAQLAEQSGDTRQANQWRTLAR